MLFRSRVERLGIDNVELRHGSITEVGEADGKFDYVICHGVYSWVPAHVREAILGVASERLVDNGVAIVSYNVMPGWHTKRIVREAMLAHAGGIADPAARVGQARALMEFLKEKAPPNTPYGNVLRTEAAFLVGQRDDYILHEFLEDENSPCTVSEFVQAAERNGLSYLAETEIHTMLAETYGEETAVALRTLSGNKLLPLEQYIDIVTGRTFRQTILVKIPQARRAQRQLQPASLRDLHVSGRFKLDAERGAGGAFVFRDHADRTLTTGSATVATALEALVARYPSTVQPADLIAIATRWATDPAAEEAAVMDALFRMANVGMIDFHTVPLRVGPAAAQRPVALAVARADALAGSASTANLRHESIGIELPARAILPLLDGTRDRAALADAVTRMFLEGVLTMARDGKPVTGEAELRAGAVEQVDTTLKALEAVALLQG